VFPFTLSLFVLGNLNYLDSPFMEKSLLFSDGFGPFGVDTPSSKFGGPLTGTGGGGTGTGGGSDGVRFDFDEAVAAHFPSPRTGDHIKGNSPYRWSGGSASSNVANFFNFPDSSLANQQQQQRLSNSSLTGSDDRQQQNQQSSNANNNETADSSAYAKKFKKALKKDNQPATSTNDSSFNNASNNNNQQQSIFQSPAPPQTSSQQQSQQARETRSRTNSKVRPSFSF
jgi:hypothetical protein